MPRVNWQCASATGEPQLAAAMVTLSHPRGTVSSVVGTSRIRSCGSSERSACNCRSTTRCHDVPQGCHRHGRQCRHGAHTNANSTLENPRGGEATRITRAASRTHMHSKPTVGQETPLLELLAASACPWFLNLRPSTINPTTVLPSNRHTHSAAHGRQNTESTATQQPHLQEHDGDDAGPHSAPAPQRHSSLGHPQTLVIAR